MARVQVPSLKCFASAFLQVVVSVGASRPKAKKRILTPF